jgi:hypothetical protein
MANFTQFLKNGGTLEQAAAALADSREYAQTRGGGTAVGFLAALYQDALQRSMDAGGEGVFTTSLASGTTHGQIAAAVFASTEYRQDLITGFYKAALSRIPDIAGMNHFVVALGLGSRDEDVLATILGSDEYFGRL